MASVAEAFVSAINGMTPDLDDLYEGAKNYSLSDWEVQQRALVTASGAAAVAIPVAHLAGLLADLAFVINRMGVSTYGVGAIRGNGAGLGNLLEREDFGAVLGYWSHDGDVMEAMKGKGAADLSAKVGVKVIAKVAGKAGTKIVLKGLTAAMLSSVGYLAASRFGAKAMAKPAAKFAAKFGGKALGGFVPFVGPAVGGAINLWLISTIMDAAQSFYDDKIKLVRRLV